MKKSESYFTCPNYWENGCNGNMVGHTQTTIRCQRCGLTVAFPNFLVSKGKQDIKGEDNGNASN